MTDSVIITNDEYILEIYNLDNAINIKDQTSVLIVSSDRDLIIINEINDVIQVNENPVMIGGGGIQNSYFPSGWN